MKPTSPTRATALIMAAAMLWGLIGPFSVWAAREGLTAMQTAFWRTGLAAVPFLLAAGARPFRMRPGPAVLVVIFGVAGIATMYVAFFIAVQRVGVGVAAVLLYTGPAWVALYEAVAHRRLPSVSTLFALLLTISGVVLVSYVFGSGVPLDRAGIVAGLIAGMAYSTHYLLGRRLFSEHGALPVFAIAMSVAAVAIAPLARPHLPAAGAWPPILFLSLIATFVTSLMFARGVVQVTPVRAAITATIEPVVALLAAVTVLHTALHAQQLLGALLVLSGVTLVVLQRGDRQETTASAGVSNHA